jgi:hypothetical protein
VGQVGIDPDKFWNYTYKEVLLLGEHFKFTQNLEWERVRYLSAQIFNARAEKNSQLVKPTKFFPLPQDKALRPSKPNSTYHEYVKAVERINAITKQNIKAFELKKA